MTRTGRLGFVHAVLVLFGIAILVRAGRVQLVQRDKWEKSASNQQLKSIALPAPRGIISDASGRVLAENRPMVQLAIAPTELADTNGVVTALSRAGVPREYIARIHDPKRRWITIPGSYVATDLGAAIHGRGVYVTSVPQRMYALSVSSAGIVGRVDAANKPLDGLELALDDLLRGTDGERQLAQDAIRRTYGSPSSNERLPVDGHSVSLTINFALQEIAEGALRRAVDTLRAEGGDIVIMNPHDGSILALASYRGGEQATTAGALTEPFEPGSTLKPFAAAALMERGLATADDSIDIGNGEYEINGRTIHDDHPEATRLSLADVIRVSSNVGIVKFSERLTPAMQFEMLRDFGFGSPTGVTYPSEASGRLARPNTWNHQTANSMSMGYEVSVTPLQLATAYSVFANGGLLIQPSLVQEVRAAGGAVIYRHSPRTVRRVVSQGTADRMREMLLGVVDSGTALSADLSLYQLAGKTGTPRATVNGRYVDGRYNPNFVGLFPGDAPQLVIVVKISNPSTTKYGATTAAPVTKAVIEAAIAAKDAALDLKKLASSERPLRGRSDSMVPIATEVAVDVAQQGRAVPSIGTGDARTPVETDRPSKVLITLPAVASAAAAPIDAQPVPSIAGLPLRSAVRSLHKAGFRVRLVRSPVGTTSPEAGALLPPGSLVVLKHPY